MIKEDKPVLKKRWVRKEKSVYNLKDNIDRLKRKVRSDLNSSDEKTMLTACIIRIMMKTSERVGNGDSAQKGHFGITELKPRHIMITGNQVTMKYKGKSGVDHEKSFSDEIVADILRTLKKRMHTKLFTTDEGFEIRADKVNRYLKPFDAKTKDIRGYNCNEFMIRELHSIGRIKDEKERPKVFNEALRKVAKKIGHGAATLRKHYLLPEIEKSFYATGSVKKIKL
jgi:DNA topoisomerase-1